MTSEDNVVKMPNQLERRAQRIEAAMNRREKGDSEWVEATLDLAIELAGARDDHGKDNNAFGRWLDSRFGNKAPSHQDRAALIRWGKDPVQTRILLEKRETNSIRIIDEGFTKAGKTPSAPSKPRVNKAEATATVIKTMTGKWPTSSTLAEVAGVAPRSADNALRTLKAVEVAKGTPELHVTKAQDYHLDAILKLKFKELEKEFDDRVTRETKARIDLLFPGLEKLRDEAKRNEDLYRRMIEKEAVLTKPEYVDILFCVHNEFVEAERRKRAGIALISKKLQLTGEK